MATVQRLRSRAAGPQGAGSVSLCSFQTAHALGLEVSTKRVSPEKAPLSRL